MPAIGQAMGGGIIGTAMVRVMADTSNLVAGIKSSTTALRQLATAGVLIFGVARAVKATTAEFIAFDKALHNTWTLIDGTRSQLQNLGSQTRAMAKQFHVSSVEAQESLYQIYSAVFYGKDAFNILEQSIKGSAAGLASLFSTVDMVTTVLNAYGMKAQEAAHINDLLFTSIKYGKTTLSELSSQFGRLAGVAAPVGASVSDMTAAIATLTRQGIRTDWAITSLRQTLMQFIKPVKNLKKAIKALGYESGTSMVKSLGFAKALKMTTKWAEDNNVEMSEMFTNVRAITAVLPLATTAAAGYADDLTRMANSTGAATEAFIKQTDSMSYKLGVMKTLISDFAISLGGVVVNALYTFTTALALAARPLAVVLETLNKYASLGIFVTAAAGITLFTLAANKLTIAMKAMKAQFIGSKMLTMLGSSPFLQGNRRGGIGSAGIGSSFLRKLPMLNPMNSGNQQALPGGGRGLTDAFKLKRSMAGLAKGALGIGGALVAVDALVDLNVKLGTVTGMEAVKAGLYASVKSILGGALAGAMMASLFGLSGGTGMLIGAAVMGTAALSINIYHYIKEVKADAEERRQTAKEIIEGVSPESTVQMAGRATNIYNPYTGKAAIQYGNEDTQITQLAKHMFSQAGISHVLQSELDAMKVALKDYYYYAGEGVWKLGEDHKRLNDIIDSTGLTGIAAWSDVSGLVDDFYDKVTGHPMDANMSLEDRTSEDLSSIYLSKFSTERMDGFVSDIQRATDALYGINTDDLDAIFQDVSDLISYLSGNNTPMVFEKVQETVNELLADITDLPEKHKMAALIRLFNIMPTSLIGLFNDVVTGIEISAQDLATFLIGLGTGAETSSGAFVQTTIYDDLFSSSQSMSVFQDQLTDLTRTVDQQKETWDDAIGVYNLWQNTSENLSGVIDQNSDSGKRFIKTLDYMLNGWAEMLSVERELVDQTKTLSEAFSEIKLSDISGGISALKDSITDELNSAFEDITIRGYNTDIDKLAAIRRLDESIGSSAPVYIPEPTDIIVEADPAEAYIAAIIQKFSDLPAAILKAEEAFEAFYDNPSFAEGISPENLTKIRAAYEALQLEHEKYITFLDKYKDEITTVMNGIESVAKTVAAAALPEGTGFEGVASSGISLGFDIGSVLMGLADPITLITSAFKVLVEVINYVVASVQELEAFITDAVNSLIDATLNLANSFKNLFTSTENYSNLQDGLVTIQSMLFNAMTGFLSLIWGVLRIFISEVDEMSSYTSDVADSMSETSKTMNSLNVPTGYKVERAMWKAATAGQPGDLIDDGSSDSSDDDPSVLETALEGEAKWLFELMAKFGDQIKEVAGKFNEFLTIMGSVWSALGEVVIPVVLTSLGTFADGLIDLANHVKTDLLPIFSEYMPNIIGNALDFFFSAITGIAKLFIDVLAGILPSLSKFSDILKPLGKQLKVTFEKIGKALIPVINSLIDNVFIPLGEILSSTIIPAFEALLPPLSAMLVSLAESFGKMMPQVTEALLRLFKVIDDNWPVIEEWLTNQLQTAISGLVGSLEIASAYIQAESGDLMGALDTIWSSESLTFWQKLKASAGIEGKAVWDAVKGIFEWGANLIVAILRGLVNSLIFALNLLIYPVKLVGVILYNLYVAINNAIQWISHALNPLSSGNQLQYKPIPGFDTISYLAEGGNLLSDGIVYGHKGEVMQPADTSPLSNYSGSGSIENTILLDGEVLYHGIKNINRQEQLRRTGSSVGGRAWNSG